MQWAKQTRGFTIVELLIVIVVIAILAAITIVAYNGIQNRARSSALSSDVLQGAKALEQAKVVDGIYPSTLPANINSSLMYYTPQNNATFCLEGRNGSIVYSAVNGDTTPKNEPCARNGLLGWWDLNDSASDTLGNNNNGTVTAATATTGANGRSSGAYTFTANSSTLVALPRPREYTNLTTPGFSISAWIKTTSSAVQQSVFSTAGSGNGVRFGHSNGRPYYLAGNTSGYREQNIGSSNILNNDQWHHLAMTFENRSTGYFVTAYIDGAVAGTDTTTVTMVGPGSLAYIGSMNGAAQAAFSGSIDDVRIYGRSLVAAEVSSLYALGAQ